MKHIQVPTLVIILAMVMASRAGVVTNSGDTGPGSLRGEITRAAPGETITFAPSLDGATITLAGGPLTVDKDLAIDASGLAQAVTIDGNGAVTHQRVFQIANGTNVIMDSLIITGGTTPDAVEEDEDAEGGGGIHNAGVLTIRNTVIRGNTTGKGGDADNEIEPNRGGGGGGGEGGGIFNSGDLILENVTVFDNTTGNGGVGIGGYTAVVDWTYGDWIFDVPSRGGPGGPGGGISNRGTLVLRKSAVHGNSTGNGGDGLPNETEGEPDGAPGPPGSGGGIHNTGILTIARSAVSDNTTGIRELTESGRAQFRGAGGGIHAAGGTLMIDRSEICGNATGSGGGLYVIDTFLAITRTTIARTTISGNAAGTGNGGGVSITKGTHVIEACTISGNRTGEGIEFGGAGGGLFVDGGSLTLRNSTIANNETGEGGFRGGSGGGVFHAGGTFQVLCSTITGNITGEGGTHSGGVGGLYTQGGSLMIENSIIAGNHSGTGDPNYENGGSGVTREGRNITSGDPMLAPLGFYGGPTRTMPPYPDSPVIDIGGGTGNTPNVDQRGQPRITGGRLDLGAVEHADTGYAAWAFATIPRDLDASFDADPDGDGISNGMVYATGGMVPTLSRNRGVVEFIFASRPEAEDDLVWKVLRSEDMRKFIEILCIEQGGETLAPGVHLLGAPSVYTLRDENPPSGAAYYRLEMELAVR